MDWNVKVGGLDTLPFKDNKFGGPDAIKYIVGSFDYISEFGSFCPELSLRLWTPVTVESP